ncbi:MAG: FctA domain-containing protein [Enterococcus aquimarinus]
MKKLLSLAMALVLGLSMSAPVLAVGVVGGNAYPYTDETKIKIDKEIKLTNEGTVNPAEIFNFTVGTGTVDGTGVSGVTAPKINDFSISFDEEGQVASSTDLQLPTFKHVGVYTYEISETAGNTAGMRYNEKAYKLQVTVFNDGVGGFKRVVTLVTGENDVKTDKILNTFEAGELVVTKEITGNFSQSDDTFEVTVTLTPDEGKNLKEGPITVTGAVEDSGTVNRNGDEVTVTFTVTDGSEVKIANVPYDVSYVVTEDSGDYKEKITDTDNGKIDKDTQKVKIVNTLDQEVATGVNLDNLPYILVLALVGVGLISFTVRKRVRN